MSRRIVTRATVLGAPAGPDDYLARLLKYIPAEVVTLYVSATGIVPSAAANRTRILWAIFAFCAVATPMYLIFATRDKSRSPLWTQVFLATIAFPVWAYALGGVFTATPGYEPYIGSLALMAVTFVFGLIKP